MKEKLVKYLQALDVSQTVLKRVHDIYDFYARTLSLDITGIFITEYRTQDGTREYENLWFFSDVYVMEANDFMTADDFDVVPLKNNIQRIAISAQHFNFVSADGKSRLRVELRFPDTLGGTLKASSENCEHLMAILKEHLTPNLYTAGTPL